MSFCICKRGNRMCDGCMDCYEEPKEEEVEEYEDDSWIDEVEEDYDE